jgi:hypothetical protein
MMPIVAREDHIAANFNYIVVGKQFFIFNYIGELWKYSKY